MMLTHVVLSSASFDEDMEFFVEYCQATTNAIHSWVERCHESGDGGAETSVMQDIMASGNRIPTDEFLEIVANMLVRDESDDPELMIADWKDRKAV